LIVSNSSCSNQKLYDLDMAFLSGNVQRGLPISFRLIHSGAGYKQNSRDLIMAFF
jgi:hypothetical protein